MLFFYQSSISGDFFCKTKLGIPELRLTYGLNLPTGINIYNSSLYKIQKYGCLVY